MVSQRTVDRKVNKAAAAKSERLEARVTVHQKALYARAAELSGRSFTDFIIAALNEAAARAVRDHEVMTLSAKDSAAFAAALLRPAAPGKRLRKAAERYRKAAGV
jgi:uncharacterized protein (DUF1778 family)